MTSARNVEPMTAFLARVMRTARENEVPLILSLLILFHVVSNAIILYNHQTPPVDDAAFYQQKSLEMHDLLRQGRVKEALSVHDRYSPLFLYLTQPFYLFGRSHKNALLVNNLFWALLIIGTFLTGRELFSKRAGLLAAFLVSFYPQVYGMSRVYMLDFALTATVSMVLYLVLKTQGFMRRKPSLMLGTWIGVSALIKPVMIVSIGGPLLVAFLMRRETGQQLLLPARIKNALLTMGTSLAVYSPWLIPQARLIFSDSMTHITTPFSPEALSFWMKGAYYLRFMFNYQLLYPLALLFTIGLMVFLLEKGNVERPWKKAFLLLHLVIPYLFFSFVVQARDTRYILPLAVGISLISAAFVMSRKRRLRNWLVLLCIIIALVQFFLLSTGTYQAPGQARARSIPAWYFRMFSNIGPDAEATFGIFEPSSDGLGTDEIVDALTSGSADTAGRRYVLVPDCSWVFPMLTYQQQLRQLNIKLLEPSCTPVSPEKIFLDSVSLERIRPDYFMQVLETESLFCNRSAKAVQRWDDSASLVASIEVHPWANACSCMTFPPAVCPEEYEAEVRIYRFTQDRAESMGGGGER